MDNDDRRKYPRIDLAFDVKYNTTDEPKARNSNAQNVSTGGVAFKTEKQYSEGTYVRVKLSQPDLTNELEFVGRVVRSLDREGSIYTAIEFTEVNMASLEILESIIYF